MAPRARLVLALTLAACFRVSAARAERVGARPLAPEPHRALERPRIDGRLDDPAWATADFVSGFTQRSPRPGRAPRSPTEVAVVYDDTRLYVAFRCEGEPQAFLSPRDVLPADADHVMVFVDGARDRRTARAFAVTAAGVRADGALAFDSPSIDFSWNGLWRSAVEHGETGWTAELAIPFSALGITRRNPRIGIHFRRYFARGAVTAELGAVPYTSAAFVSRFRRIGPLRGVSPRRRLDLTPYVRFDVRPRVAEGAAIRRAPFEASSGLDVRVGLGADRALRLAALPDFGETEVDPAVLNLTAYETFYPERRQLFLEDADLFRFASPTDRSDRQAFQLLHTRRIGARPGAPDLAEGERLVEMDEVAPVEAVARMTGYVARRTALGILAAMTGPAEAVVATALGEERRVRLAERRLFGAARARQSFGRRSSYGGMMTGASDLDGGDAAFVAAADVDWQPRGSSHRLAAVAAGSYAGGAEGGGLHVVAGRLGGSGPRWRATGLLYSPDLEVNDLGFLRRADLAGGNITAGWVFTSLPRPLHRVYVETEGDAIWNWEGLLVRGGAGLNTLFGLTSRDWALLDLWISPDYWDDLETRGGPPVHRPGYTWARMALGSATSRAFSATVALAGDDCPEDSGVSASLAVRWTPLRQLTLRLEGRYGRRWDDAIWVEDVESPVDGALRPLLGRLWLDVLELDLHATVALSPSVSVQAFVQLLGTAGDYRQYLIMEPGGRQPYEPAEEHDFDGLVLLANVVARWEVRPGAVLYAVYTHSGEGSGLDGRLDLPRHLLAAAWSGASDLFLLKLEVGLR